MARLRELADEFGYWPASTNEADIDRHCQLNAFDHLRRAAEKSRQAVAE